MQLPIGITTLGWGTVLLTNSNLMFKKFNSIENTYRKEFINRIQLGGYWDDTYVVQEKVHGANLSFYTLDGLSFTACKRSSPIAAEENFYRSEQILTDNLERLRTIWNKLRVATPGMQQLTVFGEVLGGSYPHPDVPKNNAAQRVQKGVFYSPDNLFYAFDIMVDGHYLNVAQANACFEESGMLYARTLFTGSLEKALAYPNDFNSTLPASLGLPSIPDNVVEGTIIRPARTTYLKSGQRVILKNKNAKWAEKKQRSKTATPQEPLPTHIQELKSLALEYVTENRLENVISKIGEVSIKDFGRVLGAFNQDIFEDFHKENEAVLSTVAKTDLKRVNKLFGKAAAGLVRKRLLQ